MEETIATPSYAKLALALSKAQSVMDGAHKDNKGNFGKYATLSSVWDACRLPLGMNELAVVQFPTSDGCDVSVRTMLLHSSGEYLETTITAKAKDASPQSVGSVITYLRRYSLSSMVGIAPEDDDGQAAQPAPKAVEAPKAAPKPVTKPGNAMEQPVLDADAPMISKSQVQQLGIECVRVFGKSDEDTARARAFIGQKIGREIVSRKALTEAEAARMLAGFNSLPDGKFFLTPTTQGA